MNTTQTHPSPSTWVPKVPADFIGPAGDRAQALARKLARVKDTGQSVRLLFWGKPGCGKTVLCDCLASQLCGKANIETLNGREINISKAREWLNDLSLMPNGWRVVHISEVDTATADVQKLLLSFFDRVREAKYWAVFATTNEHPESFVDRFQSRFQIMQIDPPKKADVVNLIQRLWPQVPAEVVKQVCVTSDMRAALNDVETWLDMNG